MFKQFLNCILHLNIFLCSFLSFASIPPDQNESFIYQRVLDPESQQFLDAFSLQGFLKKPLSLASIKETEDLKISGSNGPIPLRIYSPLGEGPFPVVIYFPGGGWISGNLDSNDSICREICSQAHCLIVSVEYHKAPDYPFPQPLEDCYTALEWTAKSIQNFNGDASWIAVSGDSAGGNLAAALTLLTRDRQGPSLKCQVLMYPVTNFCLETLSYYQNGQGYLLTRQDMERLWKLYLQKSSAKDPYASPLQGNLTGLPSAFIITAEFDPLRDDGFAYAYQLQLFGVPIRLKNYPTFHAFIRYAYYISLGKQALADIAIFLKEQYALDKAESWKLSRVKQKNLRDVLGKAQSENTMPYEKEPPVYVGPSDLKSFFALPRPHGLGYEI